MSARFISISGRRAEVSVKRETGRKERDMGLVLLLKVNTLTQLLPPPPLLVT